MSIRKEQVLLILVVLVAALVARGYFKTDQLVVKVNPGAIEYEPAPFAPAGLASAETPKMVRRDPSTEPSETRPLPPRELAFPPRRALTLAALPLDPGPDYGHSWLLAEDGEIVYGVTVDTSAATGGGALAEEGSEGGDDEVVADLQGVSAAQAAKLYDRVFIEGLSNPEYGRIEPQPGVDLFALEEGGDFSDVTLRVRLFSRKKNELGRVARFGAGTSQSIKSIALADTTRNAVTRMVRKVPDDAGAQQQRLDLIEWLLEQGRREAWIYDIALEQAETYMQQSGGTMDGLRVMQKVLQALGDISGELKLLEGIEGDAVARSFQLTGLGVIKARLGLWVEAEQHLVEAAQLQPNDARPHGALAEFYRQRGRSREAMAAARLAQQTLGSVQDKQERQRIVRTIVGCMLAVGDLAGARELVPAEPGQSYLRGCVAYAAADVEAAAAAFAQAGTSDDAGLAQLGQAACLLRQEKWQEAHDLFVRTADLFPLLRHRAQTGLALLFSRIGQFDTALTWVDRALEASPGDPYALYLRGRTLRLMGQFGAAEEAISETLQARDDFGHAIAEMSAVQNGLAREAVGVDQAKALLAARRYLDRAVALAPEPVLELYELQGLRAFRAADWRAARDAFDRARALAEDETRQAFAKGAQAVVTYSRGRVDEAQDSLERLERDVGRDTEMGKWAGGTVTAIVDHAQKEALGDSFDRDELGSTWDGEGDGQLRARIDDGQLVFSGKLASKSEVRAARVDAVAKGKNFLAVSAKVGLGSRHEALDSFCGLGIELQRGRNGVDLSVRVGVEDGRQPHLRILDGQQNGRPDDQRIDLAAPLRPGEMQELELRVVPRAEGDRQLDLQVWFNNVLTHTHELKQLTTSSGQELKTILFAEGRKGTTVDVAFDGYELERRKDT